MSEIAFSFCSLVTNAQMYDDMVASAKKAGFDEDCEFLKVDNTRSPQADAYIGLNSLIENATGRYAVLLHQDILFDHDNRDVLEERLNKLQASNASWAVCGIAGRTSGGASVTRISDKFGDDQKTGLFPSPVVSLDECFLVVKCNTGLRLSADIQGFHLYGTDICLMAEIMGHSAHAIDFHISHLGKGEVREDYHLAAESFKTKWSTAFRDRYLRTTAHDQFISGRMDGGLARRFRKYLAKKKMKRESV